MEQWNLHQLSCMMINHTAFVEGICVNKFCQAPQRIACVECLNTFHEQCQKIHFLPKKVFIENLQDYKQEIQQVMRQQLDRQKFETLKLSVIKQLDLLSAVYDEMGNVEDQKISLITEIDTILSNYLSQDRWMDGYKLLEGKKSFKDDLSKDNINQTIELIRSRVNELNNYLMIQQENKFTYSYKQKTQIQAASRITCIRISPGGQYIISAQENDIYMWDPQSGLQIGQALIGHTDRVWSLVYSTDGLYIISGSSDNTVRVWRSPSGEQVGQNLIGHCDTIWSVAYSIQDIIASGSSDKTIRLWHCGSGQQIGMSLMGHTNSVLSVCFSPNGNSLISGGRDNTVRMWNPNTRQQVACLTGHLNHVISLSYSPLGRYFVSASRDLTLRIWDSIQKKQIGESIEGHTATIQSVQYSPSGDKIISAGFDKTIRIWDAVQRIQVGSYIGHTDAISSVQYSFNEKSIISGGFDGQIIVIQKIINQNN